jgi:hypothetical protein
VASIDAHTIHALDATNGRCIWRHRVGGRVDSPPTLYRDRVLFGCADGWIYCLRANDGALIWRYLAAPRDRRTLSHGQVESVWPVTGSVLVHDDVLYATAGRSSYLDGGMVWLRLDPVTGKLKRRRVFYDRDPQTGAQPEAQVHDVEMPGTLPDVLACDGTSIFWRDRRLDLEGREREANVPHLYSPVGFLDDHWWHRAYWIYGTAVYGRASGWAVVPNHVPSGRLLSQAEDSIFGFGKKRVGYGDRGLYDVAYQLFRADKTVKPIPGQKRLKNNNLALVENFRPTRVQHHWTQDTDLAVRALVLTGDTLFAAGPRIDGDRSAGEPTFDGQGEAVLIAVRAEDGARLATLKLDGRPVFDGMIATSGRLYLSLRDGRIVCLQDIEKADR